MKVQSLVSIKVGSSNGSVGNKLHVQLSFDLDVTHVAVAAPVSTD